MLELSSRKFNLRDAMILIAALAVAIAFALRAMPGFPVVDQTVRGTRDLISYWTVGLLPSVAVLTLATFILRLLPPRPALRHLASQSGTVACGTAVFVMAAGALIRLFIWSMTGFWAQDWTSFFHPAGVPFTVVAPMEIVISYSVALAWLLLALSGRWRSEPSWVDRLGRLLGAVWVALVPAYHWIARWF